MLWMNLSVAIKHMKCTLGNKSCKNWCEVAAYTDYKIPKEAKSLGYLSCKL